MIRRYPSLLLLVFVIAGIIISDQTRLPSWTFLAASLICCLAGLLSLTKPSQRRSVILLVASLMFFAAFNFASRLYDVGPYHISRSFEDGRRYHIYGRVCDWPDLKTNRTEIKIALDSLGDDVIRRADGKIMLKLSDTTTALQRGDRIELQGRIYRLKGSSMPGKFDYRRYLNLRGVFGIVYLPTLLDVRIDKANRYGLFGVVDKLRTAIRDSFYRNLSPTAAALAAGFLIGETRNIPATIYRQFRDTGTMHLLAVSGSNVALVVLAFVFLLRPLRLSPRRRAVALLVVVFVFALLSYGEPSVVRASVMAALVIGARFLQRRIDLNNTIAATALIILLLQPAQLFDVGFQLSFVTAWGLIFLTPRLAAPFKRYHSRRWYRWLVFPLLISLVAQVCSAPLIVLYFHRLPIISVVANLIIVPLVSVAVIGVILLLVAHLIWPLLGLLVGSIQNQLLMLIVLLLSGLGAEQIPLLKISDIPPVAVVLFYVFLVLSVVSLRSKPVRRVLLLSIMVVINMALVTSVVTTRQQPPRTDIHVFGLPGGTGAVIRQNGNEADLIVTGLAGRDYPVDEQILLPLLEGLQTDRLRFLVTVAADYDAADDLIRLARKLHVQTIYAAADLEQVFADIVHFDPDGQSVEIIRWRTNRLTVDRPGYHCIDEGLLANFGTTAVLFADRLNPQQVTMIPRAPDQTLLVCAQFTSPKTDTSSWADRFEAASTVHRLLAVIPPGQDTPGPVYDLNRVGAVRIDLWPDDPAAMKVIPLP
ncbi:MAG: ComEC/Rec2 family competence protein [bacterium]